MGNGRIGDKGPGTVGGPAGPQDIQEVNKQDASKEKVSAPIKEGKAQAAPDTAGKSREDLIHDPAVNLRKAAIDKTAGLKKPSKAQLEEIRKAIADGDKEKAINLTIKYFNIDTSGAHEVRYAGDSKKTAPNVANAKQTAYQEIGTATHIRNGKVVIEIGDESFKFKPGGGGTGDGIISPEWLAAAIFHESFHAKHHFGVDSHAPSVSPQNIATDQPQMSQDVLIEEIEAYAKERAEADKLGLSPDMLKELDQRQNKLYAQLTEENRGLVREMIRGKLPWPHQKAHH